MSALHGNDPDDKPDDKTVFTLEACRRSPGEGRRAEPTLRELLDAPIVQSLMRSDRVVASDIEALFGMAAGTGRPRSDGQG